MTFNKILKSLREDIDINQKDLADKLNINPATYRNYENGNREPDFTILINISRFFNVSTDYLLGLTEFKNCEHYRQTANEPHPPEDEQQIIKLYRKLPPELKAEIRGEIKGILRTTQEEQSAALSNDSTSNKKVI